jgi:hypothetical protein
MYRGLRANGVSIYIYNRKPKDEVLSRIADTPCILSTPTTHDCSVTARGGSGSTGLCGSRAPHLCSTPFSRQRFARFQRCTRSGLIRHRWIRSIPSILPSLHPVVPRTRPSIAAPSDYGSMIGSSLLCGTENQFSDLISVP